MPISNGSCPHACIERQLSQCLYRTAAAQMPVQVRAITLLLPEQFHAFSAARYDRTHHIAPHDDRAYTPVQLDTGAPQQWE